jgi:hypothetical protein
MLIAFVPVSSALIWGKVVGAKLRFVARSIHGRNLLAFELEKIIRVDTEQSLVFLGALYPK